MRDLLLEVGKNPRARRVVQTLGLPLPLPVALERTRPPIAALPLADRAVLVGADPLGASLPALADALVRLGAAPHVDTERLLPSFRSASEAFARPARLGLPDGKAHALVFDAVSVADAAGLRAVFDFFHANLERLSRGGRALVLADAAPRGADAAAAQAALEGFVRSLAKEIGRRGATANLLRVERAAFDRVAGPLAFLLSPASAFVTGQPLTVDARTVGTPTSFEPRSLSRKVAIVTGAARGIGAATVRALAAEGARVICLDRPEDDALAASLAREIGGHVLRLDVASADAANELALAIDAHGGVDIVVHNAGITRDKTLARMSEAQWDAVLDVNLAAISRLHSAIAPRMRAGGRIIALASIAGIAGNVGQTNYAASKSGVIGWVRALAPELAGRGITVNAVAPGFIETRMTAAIPLTIREAARRLSALGQGGLPEDVASAIRFLALPSSSGVSGQVLRVCGGALVGA
jgi:3-oxoacyl-[acyl-carrier protein] reductase